jgi:hypothetical protein
VRLQSAFYPDNAGVALDVDATVYPLILDNCFFQTGSTLSVVGLTKLFDSGQSTFSGTINPLVLYDLSSVATNAITTINSTVTGRMKVPLVLTASLPVAAVADDGLLIIEQGAAGDMNLVFYAAGERHRVDGGGNV